jgi:hypothetical protein
MNSPYGPYGRPYGYGGYHQPLGGGGGYDAFDEFNEYGCPRPRFKQ